MPQSSLRRIIDPFVLVFTTLIGILYAYTAWSLTDLPWLQIALAIPFIFVWIVPVVYWHGQRESRQMRLMDHIVHVACFLSMGWLNFVTSLTVLQDLLSTVFLEIGQLRGATEGTATVSPGPLWPPWAGEHGEFAIIFAATLCWLLGTLKATRGPLLKEVEVEIPNLHPFLHHLRIVQISDLHVGTTIRQNYVERIVAQSNALHPDLVVLTGDLVDGSVEDLGDHALPLRDLRATYGSFMCLGNHDYYSGSEKWTQFWTQHAGVVVLRNEHVSIPIKPPLGERPDGNAPVLLMVAGVIDPAVRLEGTGDKPDPHKALATPYLTSPRPAPLATHALKLMLAHNPKLSTLVASAGFDLQLSGHTHAGQFLPWTWATRLVHHPHYVGLSHEGKMTVYVNPGTGSWGPPLRFGTTTELTLLRLVPGNDLVG